MSTPYTNLLERLSERVPDATRTEDLPPLSEHDLGAITAHYPNVLIDALAQYEPIPSTMIRDYLLDTAHNEDTQLALVGLVIVEAIRRYALPLVLRDVQAFLERQREADSIEAGNDHGDTLTADQLQACELGLGRSLNS